MAVPRPFHTFISAFMRVKFKDNASLHPLSLMTVKVGSEVIYFPKVFEI